MITVVSGLPRSGTSLMMQMLESAGLEIVTDRVRTADEDNPRGYYEVERIKKLDKDATWVAEAEGKVIKVISMLLSALPEDHEYKVVFMLRHLDEVLASQRKMLERRQVDDKGPDDEVMKGHLQKHLDKVEKWLADAGHMEALYCDYNQLVKDPGPQIEPLARFLDLSSDSASAMASPIEQSLYRQRR